MESTVALWNANLSGNQTDYKKLLTMELDFNNANQTKSGQFTPDKFVPFSENVFTKEKDFELLRKLKNSKLITDPMLKRQLTVLYQSFMGSQIEESRFKKLKFDETKIWQSYSTIQAVVGDKKYAGVQLDSIWKNSTDTALLKKVYNAYRYKGRQIAGDIIQMVKTKNKFAREFGYTDYYQLALEIKDQTPEMIKTLLDSIELKTHNPFFEAKLQVDKVLAKKYHYPKEAILSYLYNDERASYLPQFFSAKMDSLFGKRDPIRLVSGFFNGVGLPIHDAIYHSDLKPKKGKSAGTIFFNVDFKNDLRMMASIQENADGARKMMHLCGHASHFNNISDTIPYLLKYPNSVVAEGISSFFENLTMNSDWLQREFDLDSVRNQEYKLLCMHFMQVDRMFRFRRLLVKSIFEREVYQDPDQNLGELWYQLNEKYLGIKPPKDPGTTDWATSSYFTSFSCSVHDFVLAELFAGQLRHYMEKNILTGKNTYYQENKKVGEFLISQIYQYGDLITWDRLIEQATGEPLNPIYYANLLTRDSEENEALKISAIQAKKSSTKH
jgi:peptidyl-dipeptidase A